MRVYNINKAIGYASSGVEYAQMYRRDLLATIDWVDPFYVFTDYIHTNPCVFTDLTGFERATVLWIYNLVTGRPTAPCTLTVEAFLASLTGPYEVQQTFTNGCDVVMTSQPIRYQIRTVNTPDGRFVNHIDTAVDGVLLRADHYDSTLNHVEHFHGGRLVRRDFYTEDGCLAAWQTYTADRDIVRTTITPASPLYDAGAGPSATVSRHRDRPASFGGDILLEGRVQFFQYVFARLWDRPDDVIIVDRALDVIDGIYPAIGDHRLYSIVHAEHYDLKHWDDGVLLWNNHYENVFMRPDYVDGLVVSTRRQADLLEDQLTQCYPGREIPIATIPVGTVTQPASVDDYDRNAIVTASRLADEKHLDWLVRAVAIARKTFPDLRLDIYGEGKRDLLVATIADTGTQDCVRLMGHQPLDGLLTGYALYASASTSEGFGLSLLEALSQGLPIIGFDVDYGNREMVTPGVNGLLVPRQASDDANITALATAIIDTLTHPDLDQWRQASLRAADTYTSAHVQTLWEALLRPDHSPAAAPPDTEPVDTASANSASANSASTQTLPHGRHAAATS
ncbi:MAG: glycosyltransferase [Cellulomonadaceae bacterium]|jgi:glycosyltransferase involved in cell wall biosynthesis|nr:glycosyltransferase [Cellulomonadaceae bacterium]